jgi:hypothetical protein
MRMSCTRPCSGHRNRALITIDGERLIRAAYTTGTITVYQAYGPEIAEPAVVAYLTGCAADHGVSRLPGTTVFDGARIGARSEVRINEVAHPRTRLPPDATVPIGWIAASPERSFYSTDWERYPA